MSVEAARSRAVLIARRKRTTGTRFTRTFLFFALPCTVILVLFNVYPLFFAVWQSLNNGDLAYIHPFVGLLHYGKALADPAFWSAARFTVIFTVVGVFGSWAAGLGIALLLRTRVPLAGLWRALIMLPWVVPASASAVGVLETTFDRHALLTILLHHVGFIEHDQLTTSALAVIVCVFRLWLGIPFMVMLMSSALGSVDGRVYEAAKVDGAGRWQIFTRITLPMISGPIYISWILMTIFCVNDFTTVSLFGAIREDAPQTLVSYAYRTANMSGMSLGTGIGQANAIAILMSSVLVLVAVLLFRRTRKGAADWAADANGFDAAAAPGSVRGRWWRLAATVLITAVVVAPVWSVVYQAVLGGGTLKGFLAVLNEAFGSSADFPPELPMFWQSLLLASVTVIVCIGIGAPAGYAIARGRGRAMSAFTVLIFAVQSFPVILLLFPMFWIFCVLGFINQLWTLQLAYVATTLGFAVWMFSAFLRTMPLELEEAAWSDGCSVVGAFFRVVLPNAMPAVISVGFFVFLAAWGDIQLAKTLLMTVTTPTLAVGDSLNLLFLLTPIVLFAVFSRRISLGGVTSAFSRR